MINEKHAKAYCSEDISLIENYEAAVADQTQTYDIHHKLEMFMTRNELIDAGRYYNVPARELVFLTRKEHCWWPHKGREDAREKMRQTHLGKHHSEAAKQKMSEAKLGEKNSSEQSLHNRVQKRTPMTLQLFKIRNKTTGEVRWAATRQNVVSIVNCALSTSFSLVRQLSSETKKIVDYKDWTIELATVDEASIKELVDA